MSSLLRQYLSVDASICDPIIVNHMQNNGIDLNKVTYKAVCTAVQQYIGNDNRGAAQTLRTAHIKATPSMLDMLISITTTLRSTKDDGADGVWGTRHSRSAQ
jgi:hypothetical protein